MTGSEYHAYTAYQREGMKAYYLDWDNRPHLIKAYPGKETMPFPEPLNIPKSRLVDACMQTRAGKTDISGRDLAGVLALSAGITGRAGHGASEFHFRAAPSAGALYPNEIYLAWFGNRWLPCGIYHVNPVAQRFTLLRKGNFEAMFSHAIEDAGEKGGDLQAILIVTAVFWASAWKYRERAYRYVLLDAGHLLENLRIALNAAGISHKIAYDFDDGRIERLLSIDPRREGVIAAIPLKGPRHGRHTEEIRPVDFEETLRKAGRSTGREIVYDAILSIHNASKSSRSQKGMQDLGCMEGTENLHSIPKTFCRINKADLAHSLVSRRSKRNFSKKPLENEAMMELLKLLCTCAKGFGKASPPVAASVCPSFAAVRVTGIPSGIYSIDMKGRFFSRRFSGNFGNLIARACLDQEWLSNAAVFFLFRANLEVLDETMGPRGYRYAMTGAGALGEAVYLGATALGLGACGIGAFYDDEAAMIIDDDERPLLYLVAAGPVKGNVL